MQKYSGSRCLVFGLLSFLSLGHICHPTVQVRVKPKNHTSSPNNLQSGIKYLFQRYLLNPLSDLRETLQKGPKLFATFKIRYPPKSINNDRIAKCIF
jgi:hypothetical protein